MKEKQRASFFGDFTGAFADGAVLFPLLAALTLQTGMNGAILLATAGVAYLMAGFIFRVPMSVQPLKSVVVMALATGASAAEIGWSGFAVGAACLALSFCRADRFAAHVPRHIVHGLQLALGLMLMIKGSQAGFSAGNPHMQVLFLILTAAILVFSLYTDKPVMGWIATAGMLAGVFNAFHAPHAAAQAAASASSVHIGTIVALTLPQVALTLANSVIGTGDVAERFFGEKAGRVTPARLLRSIGIGNLLSAGVGGLPFCHGAGGMTAHVRGGARSWHMNLMIGGALLGLAALSLGWPSPVIPAYPKALMAALLFTTGAFHLGLVRPSWEKPELRWILIVMGIVAAVTQDMLWVAGAGITIEAFRQLRRAREAGTVKT